MNQGNWKAWVDNMPSPSSKRPTLHVSGTIKVGDKAKHDLEPADDIPVFNPKIRLFRVVPTPTEGDEDEAIKYSEPINEANQYDQVQVIIRGEETVTIDIEQVSLAAQSQTESQAEKGM